MSRDPARDPAACHRADMAEQLVFQAIRMIQDQPQAVKSSSVAPGAPATVMTGSFDTLTAPLPLSCSLPAVSDPASCSELGSVLHFFLILSIPIVKVGCMRPPPWPARQGSRASDARPDVRQGSSVASRWLSDGQSQFATPSRARTRACDRYSCRPRKG